MHRRHPWCLAAGVSDSVTDQANGQRAPAAVRPNPGPVTHSGPRRGSPTSRDRGGGNSELWDVNTPTTTSARSVRKDYRRINLYQNRSPVKRDEAPRKPTKKPDSPRRHRREGRDRGTANHGTFKPDPGGPRRKKIRTAPRYNCTRDGRQLAVCGFSTTIIRPLGRRAGADQPLNQRVRGRGTIQARPAVPRAGHTGAGWTHPSTTRNAGRRSPAPGPRVRPPASEEFQHTDSRPNGFGSPRVGGAIGVVFGHVRRPPVQHAGGHPFCPDTRRPRPAAAGERAGHRGFRQSRCEWDSNQVGKQIPRPDVLSLLVRPPSRRTLARPGGDRAHAHPQPTVRALGRQAPHAQIPACRRPPNHRQRRLVPPPRRGRSAPTRRREHPPRASGSAGRMLNTATATWRRRIHHHQPIVPPDGNHQQRHASTRRHQSTTETSRSGHRYRSPSCAGRRGVRDIS